MMVFISMLESVESQSSDRNSTLLRYYCSLYYGRSPRYFLSNLNTTLSSLHQQLTNGSRYAVARTLLNGESVWGLASCRAYVSNADCVACYNYAVDQLRICGTVNGAHAFYNDCDVRYENNNFYADANIRAGVVICGNTTSPQPANFRKAVEGIMSDLRTAAPRTSNYYAASTRLVPDGNHTVYAIAQWKSTGSTDLLQGPAKYSYDDIKIATSNFCDEHKLGGGVFGEVYKGTLKDGNTVAIKKTVMDTTRGKIHIDDELKIICDKSMNLNWRQRFEIIYGTARGLAYLHEQYHVTIIHRDIKASNILLDNEFQPKIADSGLIRLLPEDKTHLSTKLAGSMDSGYVAPEYAIHGQLSEKVDTYSFGIVVLEIISGKRCHNVNGDESFGQNLLDHAWNSYDSGTHLNLVDERLDPREYAIEDVKKTIEIALMCTQSPVSERPAMSEVVTLLSDKSLDEMPPVRSTFHEDDISIKVDTLTSLSSNATASSIQLSGR
ncbi:hypothetical protein L1987_74639 [Smallanthus sonchifolius]|uniref:Uncharacterized protein n=1 Tax=Smallanthus sonchifolius TaxID=185202 RepID=A0ACB9A387_9ASTR|nr:hypothetical protein L1987_74639 [Smallanthus sonchifolius]